MSLREKHQDDYLVTNLSHLEGNNLVVFGAGRNFTIIAAKDACLVSRDLDPYPLETYMELRLGGTYPVCCNALSAEFSLVFSQSNTSSIASEILGGIGNKGSPAATNVEKPSFQIH